jgi:HK97 family phage portal protein
LRLILGIIDRFFRSKKSNKEDLRGFNLNDLDAALSGAGMGSASGANVSPKTALTLSAFYCGLFQICQTVGSLKCYTYRREGEGKRKARELPLYDVLTREPSQSVNAYTFFEVGTAHIYLHGNFYAFITRDEGFRVIGLMILDPSRMKVEVLGGERFYTYKTLNGQQIQCTQDEIFHVVGFGYDGYIGESVITLAKNSLGLSLSQEEFGGKFYANGTNLGTVLEINKPLSQEAKTKLRQQIKDKYAGAGKAWEIFIADEGMKLNRLSMPMTDAQFLESRTFSIQDVARWLNMPPHKLKDLSHGTFSNIEQEQASYYQDTIRPLLARWEAAINSQLINNLESKVLGAFAEFSTDSLLRTELVARFQAYNLGLNGGFLSRNEVRSKENLNPIPEDWADQYLQPLNMTTAGSPAATGQPAPENTGGKNAI